MIRSRSRPARTAQLVVLMVGAVGPAWSATTIHAQQMPASIAATTSAGHWRLPSAQGRHEGDVRRVNSGIGGIGGKRTTPTGNGKNLQLAFGRMPGGAYLADGAVSNAQTTRSNDARVQDAAAPHGEPQAPEVRHEDGVAYVSGGSADGAKAKTIALGSGMNLELVFAQTACGNDLANVEVAIADRSGNTVLELDSSDPLLFARVQPGSYQVTATVDGRSIERSVEVPAQGSRTEHFHWCDAPPARH